MVIAAFCALPVASSSAVTYYDYAYCGALLNPDQWCSSGATRQNIYNRALYVGSGQVRVGIRQDLAGGLILNRKFAYNDVATNSQAYYSVAQAANASSSRHTVYGYGQVCSGCASPASAKSVTRLLNTATLRTKKGMRKSVLAAKYNDGSSIATRDGNGNRCIARKQGTDYTESCVASGTTRLIVTEDFVIGVATGQTLVFGVAPANASSVRVAVGKNAAKIVPVENGVFSATVDGTADQEPFVTAIK